MPSGDGSGPLGQGALTGRGRGVCRAAGVPAAGWGRGLGLARGICGTGRCRCRGLGRQAALAAPENEQKRLRQFKTARDQEVDLLHARLGQPQA